MARRTPIHKWKVPVKGDRDYGDIFDDWFDSLDLDIEVRDVDANKGDYDPKDGAKFFATDTGDIYEGDGSSWNKLSSHSKYTDEEAQDAVGTILSSNFTYDDASDAINMSPHIGTSDAHHAKYTDEEAQDAINNLMVGGNAIAFTYDDASDTLTAAVTSNDIQADELDLTITPTWTGEHTFSGGITGLPSPTNDTDAAHKSYVDAVEQGLQIKDSVRASTDGSNIDLASATDPNPVDGVTLTDGDRILLKDQTDGTENGLYNAVTATDPTTWTRTADADDDSEVRSGLFTFVEEGTNNEGRGFVLTTNDPITVGSTALTFTQFSGAGQIKAGNALSKTGDTIDVDTNGIQVDELDESISPAWSSIHTFNAGADFQGDITDGTQIIWDVSTQEIPDSAMGSIDNSTLTNSSITVAGNSISLGGSSGIAHGDLSTIASDDHHTRYTDEESQDATNALLVGGNNVTLTYDDAANDLTIDVSSSTNDTQNYTESGTVDAGNVAVVAVKEVPDTQTLSVYEASLTNNDMSAAPSGLDLIIEDVSNNTSETTLISGDGTIKIDQSGSPLGSYTNNSGVTEYVAVSIDNGNYNTGSGNDQNVYADVNLEVS